MAERSSASDCSDGGVVRMWDQILVTTMVLVSLGKTLFFSTLILFTQEYKWVPVRVEVDILSEKASEVLWWLFTPQGADIGQG